MLKLNSRKIIDFFLFQNIVKIFGPTSFKMVTIQTQSNKSFVNKVNEELGCK